LLILLRKSFVTTFGEELRRLSEERNLSQAEVARLTGVSQPLINMIMNGKRKGTDLVIVNKVCTGLGLPLDYFARLVSPDIRVPPPPPLQLLPTNADLVAVEGYPLEVLGTIAASSLEIPEVFDPPRQIRTGFKFPRGSFALIVRGRSCEPYIPDGATVVVEPCSDAQERKYNVTQKGNEYMLKLYYGGVLYRYGQHGLEEVPLDDGQVIGVVRHVFLDNPRPPEMVLPRGKRK
jgi:transcriptional regulator with XRE-family HTH domain